MWNFFKKEANQAQPDEFVEIQFDLLKSKLREAGLSDETSTEIVDSFANSLTEEVHEKTTITYEDFFNIVEKSIEQLYVTTTDRIRLANELKQFVAANPEVSNSVRLYASYIVYGAAEIQLDEYKVVVSGDDTEKVQAAEEFLSQWERKTKIRRLMFPCAKDLVPFGDAYLEKLYDKNAKLVGVGYIPASTMFVKLRPSGEPDKYYQILDKTVKFSDFASITDITSLLQDKKVIQFEPHEILHFNDGSVIGFMDSPVRNLLIQWKFLKLLEEALLIHRVTRARRFILFFLDVTGKTKKEIRKAIMNFTNKVKRMFSFNFEEGSIDSRKSMLPATADMVIPITKDSATKVQSIPSDVSATKLDDLKFYINRVTTNLFTSHIFSPDRTGKEEYVEKAFMRFVRIYQKQMVYALEDLYTELLFQEGFKDLSVEIQFPSPDTAEEIKVIDAVVRRMMVVNQLIATMGIVPPTKWIVNYVFKDMSQFEVKQLVKMLEYAQQQQEQAAEGEEYPSFFESPEETGMSLGEEVTTEGEEQPTEETTEQFVSSLLTGLNLSRTSRVEERVDKVLENNSKVIELSLRYLEQKRGPVNNA